MFIREEVKAKMYIENQTPIQRKRHNIQLCTRQGPNYNQSGIF